MKFRVASYAMGRILASKDVEALSYQEAINKVAPSLPKGARNTNGQLFKLIGCKGIK